MSNVYGFDADAIRKAAEGMSHSEIVDLISKRSGEKGALLSTLTEIKMKWQVDGERTPLHVRRRLQARLRGVKAELQILDHQRGIAAALEREIKKQKRKESARPSADLLALRAENERAREERRRSFNARFIEVAKEYISSDDFDRIIQKVKKDMGIGSG